MSARTVLLAALGALLLAALALAWWSGGDGAAAPLHAAGASEYAAGAPRPAPAPRLEPRPAESPPDLPLATAEEQPRAPERRAAAPAPALPPPSAPTLVGHVRFPDGRGASARVVALETVGAVCKGVRGLQTDGAGRFEVQGLELDGLVLLAQASPGGPEDVWLAGPRELGAGETGRELELVLRPSERFDVDVRDDRGRVVAGLDLDLERRSPPAFAHPCELARTHAALGEPSVLVRTGGLVLAGLDAGRWCLSVRAPGHVTSGLLEFEVPHTSHLRVVLLREARASGRVVDPSGAPAAGALVLARGEGGEIGPAECDAEGAFELALAPGAHELQAFATGHGPSAAAPVALGSGGEVRGLELRLRSGGALEVAIADPRGEVELAWVRARLSDGSCERSAAAEELLARLDELPAGAYEVSAGLELRGGGASTLRASAEVVAGATTRISLSTDAPRAILVQGRVHRRGDPVAGAITLRDAARGTSRSARLDSGGAFELFVDGPGLFEHHVAAEDGGASRYGRVEVPECEQFELVLELGGAALEGVVLDPAGEPCAGVGLELAPDPSVADLSAAGASARAETDGEGRFAFRDLLAGTYALEYPLAMGRSDAPAYARRSLAGIELAEDERRAGLMLRLAPPATLQGTVRDVSGRPLAGARVVALDAGGRPVPGGEARTGADGRFLLEGLPPEALRLVALTDAQVSAVLGPLDLAAGGVREEELQLESGGELRVRVLEAGGRAVGAALRVLDAAGVDLAALARRADEGATMRVGPLPPGRYRVRALNHDRVAVEREITVRAGETAELELRL